MCEFLDEFPQPHSQYCETPDSSSVLCSHPACSLLLCLELVVMDSCGIKKKKPTKSLKQKEEERIRANQLARMKLARFSQ